MTYDEKIDFLKWVQTEQDFSGWTIISEIIEDLYRLKELDES